MLQKLVCGETKLHASRVGELRFSGHGPRGANTSHAEPPTKELRVL